MRKGSEHSAVTRLKMRLAKLGKPQAEEHRRNAARSRVGLKRSEKTRRKISESHIGLIPSEETRQKMAESARNRPKISAAARANLIRALTGRHVSEETRLKLSKIFKGCSISAKHLQALKSHWASISEEEKQERAPVRASR